MKSVAVLALVAFLAVGSEARVYGKCELARELLRFEWAFPRNLLPDWVCLVMAESSGNSMAVGPPNTDGSADYGLFQINSRYWCQIGGAGNGCQISCESLLSDDGVGAAVNCVNLVWSTTNGFEAWMGWLRACKGQQLPDLSDCGI